MYPAYLPSRAKNKDFYLKCGRGLVGKREDMVQGVEGFHPAGGEGPTATAISSDCCAESPSGAACVPPCWPHLLQIGTSGV